MHPKAVRSAKYDQKKKEAKDKRGRKKDKRYHTRSKAFSFISVIPDLQIEYEIKENSFIYFPLPH